MANEVWRIVKRVSGNPTVRRIVIESGIAVLDVVRRNMERAE